MAEGEKSPFRIWNVKTYALATVGYGLMWSISMGPTFDAYLFELARLRGRDPNLFVGTVESVSGLVSLVFALPLGILADKVSKRKLLQVACGVGTSGILCWLFGIVWDSVPLIFTGVVITAVQGQVFMATGPALVADSVPKSQVQQVTASLGALGAMCFGMGPLLQIAVELLIGNTWDLRQLHIFLAAGFIFYPLALIFVMLLRPTSVELQANGLGDELAAEAEGRSSRERAESAAVAAVDGEWKEDELFGIKKKWLVPLIIEFCGLITCIGAGMTVKFFPLFFKEDYGFSPVAFNALTVAYSLAIGCFVWAFQKVGTRIGIVPSAFLCHVLGTSCLFALWQAKALPLCVAVYLLRGGIMNAKGPIDSGIVMDCVDSKYRGRWAALQSISRVSWAGSAALGGWLADSHDYRFTFFITGCIYATSALPYASLLCIVPAHVGRKKVASDVCPADPVGLRNQADGETGRPHSSLEEIAADRTSKS